MFLFIFLLLVLAGGTVRADIVGDDSDTQPGVLYYNTANFSAGGRFESNLNVVLDFLVNGSETHRYGSGPDEAFGFRRCFYDTTPQRCSICIQQSRSELRSRIPFALGARYWRNNTQSSCYLRYENYNFFVSISPAQAPPPSPSTTNVSRSEPPLTSTGSSSKTGIYVGVGVGVAVALVLSIVSVYFFRKRRARTLLPHRSHVYSRDLEVRSNDATVFRYEALKAATGDFSKANELGKGGFGTVYKGVLNDGSQVAVKKLSLHSHQGRQEFVNEITIITGIQHKNLVRLKGYCVEEETLLVYEFMENGSLDRMLFGAGRPSLTWKTRHSIMFGVARGLAYIHEDSHVQIIHRDIKAANILLDKGLNPKISDFGISKLFDQGKGTSSTRIAGTLGYLAPEYATRGRLSAKVDVFSFGVLVLEIICGRQCNIDTLPPSEQLLLEWVWKLRQSSVGVEEAIDHRLRIDETYDPDEANRAIHIALLCTHEDERSRPMMSNVVAMLQGLMALPPLPSEPPRYFVQINALKMDSSFVSGAREQIFSLVAR